MKKEFKKVCRHCQKEFLGYQNSILCSRQCADFRRRRRREISCKQCGRVVLVRTTKKGRRHQVFCSNQCAHASMRMNLGYRFCPICLTPFERRAAHREATLCSKKCLYIWVGLCARKRRLRSNRVPAEEKPKRVPVWYEISCHQCGTLIMTKHKNRKFCSDNCQWRSGARHRKNTRTAREANHGGDEYKEERIERSEVLRRDKYRCALCGKHISRRARYPNREAGTVDHIIPLSRGGLHIWANVQAAHAGCNREKYTTARGQLRLC